MFQGIKNFLKKFLPLPVNAFNQEIKNILDAVSSGNNKLRLEIRQISEENKKLELLFEKLADDNCKIIQALEESKKMQMQLSNQTKELPTIQKDTQKIAELLTIQKNTQKMAAELLAIQTDTQKIVSHVQNTVNIVNRTASETVWAQIYNNTVVNSDWLRNRAFSPGRWAVGYPYLYVMYRVLNEARPKRILDLGLGQSTKMITQYVEAFNDVEHIVVEHDQAWIDFFLKDCQLSESTKIIRLEWEMAPYKEAEAVRTFAGFAENFQNMKFDFISIDAPWGGDMKLYSRIDILKILPNCLNSSFVIMMDDYERVGEQKTANDMDSVLSNTQIAFKSGNYTGAKSLRLWSSTDLAFLCSM